MIFSLLIRASVADDKVLQQGAEKEETAEKLQTRGVERGREKVVSGFYCCAT